MVGLPPDKALQHVRGLHSVGRTQPRHRLHIACGPLLRPDVVAFAMEPDGAAAGQVAFDFDVAGRDGPLACHADAAGSGPIPSHAAVHLRENPGKDLLPDPALQIV